MKGEDRQVPELVKDYHDTLGTWMGGGGEGALAHAYEIGRGFISSGRGVVELADIHVSAMAQALPGAASRVGCVTAVQQGDRFLAEVLAPYELMLRGYRDANASLRLLNETLDQQVRERTEALELAHSRYRHLVEHIPGIVYTLRVEPEPAFTYVSPRLQAVLGYSPDHWTWQEWKARLHEDDRDTVLEDLQRAIDQRGAFHSEYRLIASDGRPVWIRDEAHFVELSSKRVQLQGVAVDFTEQRTLENRYHQSQKMETVGRLAGGVAHDFNNVLSVILAYGELAEMRTPPGTDVHKYLDEIIKASRRGGRLTRQLLAFSRRQPAEPAILSVNTVVSEMIRMLERLVGEDVRILLQLANDTSAIRIDPGQLEQVVVNLVVNARDAMPHGGTIVIQSSEVTLGPDELAGNDRASAGRHVMVAIADDGVGMCAAVQARIFEPFFTTKGRGRGTGLGLATVFGVVRQNRGHIRVDSEPGMGTRFEVYLPVATLDQGEGGEPTTEGDDTTPNRRPPGARVLVVEDEDAMRRAMVRILRTSGYHVRSASTGEAALRKVRGRGVFELLVTDVVLPGISGWEVVEAARAATPGVRVILVSGYADDERARQGVQDERAAFLGKPFGPRQLLRKVREVLEADLATPGGARNGPPARPT